MLFTNPEYFALLGITLLLYYLKASVRWQLGVALAASAVFYGWSQPWLLLLLLASATITSCVSFAVAFEPTVLKKRLFSALGVVLNVGLLFFFKYAGFFSGVFFPGLGSPAEFLINLPLPLGISFYTFRNISLLIDTFRGDFDAQKLFDPTRAGFFSFYARSVFFILFFPQLLAGPISKAKDFMQQIQPKYFKDIPWHRVARLLILGYFLKCYCANNLQSITLLQYPWFVDVGAVQAWTLMLGFTFQLFADFAGYSLIAIGSSALLGYQLPPNFNFPFFADSFSDFWRRWHISLGSWILDYIFTPLQIRWRNWGNWATAAALFIAFFCVGIWHGAAWGFVVFGFLQGLFIACSVFYKPYQKKISKALDKRKTGLLKAAWIQRVPKVLRVSRVFLCVMLCFIFIELPNVSDALEFIKELFNPSHMGLKNNFLLGAKVFIFAFPVVVYHFLSLKKRPLRPWLEDGLLGLLLYMTIINGGPSEAFYYFQF